MKDKTWHDPAFNLPQLWKQYVLVAVLSTETRFWTSTLSLISEDGSRSSVAAPCCDFGWWDGWIFTWAIIPIHLPPYLLSGAAEESRLAGERPAASCLQRARDRQRARAEPQHLLNGLMSDNPEMNTHINTLVAHFTVHPHHTSQWNTS